MIRYKFIRSSYGYDSGIYTLLYELPIEVAEKYMNIKEGCEPTIYMISYGDNYPEVELGNHKCEKTISETFKIGE